VTCIAIYIIYVIIVVVGKNLFVVVQKTRKLKEKRRRVKQKVIKSELFDEATNLLIGGVANTANYTINNEIGATYYEGMAPRWGVIKPEDMVTQRDENDDYDVEGNQEGVEGDNSSLKKMVVRNVSFKDGYEN